jgi:hypothetical protein
MIPSQGSNADFTVTLLIRNNSAISSSLSRTNKKMTIQYVRKALQWLSASVVLFLIVGHPCHVVVHAAAASSSVQAAPFSEPALTHDDDARIVASPSTNGVRHSRQLRQFFCALPARFPANVVSAGGVSGCIQV